MKSEKERDGTNIVSPEQFSSKQRPFNTIYNISNKEGYTLVRFVTKAKLCCNTWSRKG